MSPIIPAFLQPLTTLERTPLPHHPPGNASQGEKPCREHWTCRTSGITLGALSSNS
ncbi:hypothetical protein EMIT0P100_110095 [Pseudomonas sp. IT-P100]